MKKKWLVVGVSICAVVLLVLGSLSNVVGYQINQKTQQNMLEGKINTLTSTKIEELKLVDMWLHEDIRNWCYHLGISVQNNGTKIIHFIQVNGEWNNVFYHHNVVHPDEYENDITLEPQEIYSFYIFYLPLGGVYEIFPIFVRIAVHISVDNPDYNNIDIEGKYQYSFSNGHLSPISGIWLLLANLLGR
jgi:hypothetical protein